MIKYRPRKIFLAIYVIRNCAINKAYLNYTYIHTSTLAHTHLTTYVIEEHLKYVTVPKNR